MASPLPPGQTRAFIKFRRNVFIINQPLNDIFLAIKEKLTEMIRLYSPGSLVSSKVSQGLVICVVAPA